MFFTSTAKREYQGNYTEHEGNDTKERPASTQYFIRYSHCHGRDNDAPNKALMPPSTLNFLRNVLKYRRVQAQHVSSHRHLAAANAEMLQALQRMPGVRVDAGAPPTHAS